MFDIKRKFLFLIIFATQIIAIVVQAKVNSVTGNEYTNCASGGKWCFYNPKNISSTDTSEYINNVRSEVGAVEGGRFIENHHNAIGKKTVIERSGDRIKFKSGSNNCTIGEEGEDDYKTNIKCKDLIEHWLIKHDRSEKRSNKRVFVANIIIYEFDTRKESGFKLGFQGMFDKSTTAGLSDNSSIHNTSEGATNFLQSLSSVFSLDTSNLGSGILSLNMSLGNLGGYISTYKKFRPLEIQAHTYFKSEPLKEVRFAKNTLTSPDENSKESTGLTFSGEIKTIQGEKNIVKIKNGSLQYASATNGASSAPDSYSLTRQINLNKHSYFELEVELNKPKLLFDLSTVQLQEERGAGFLFWNKVKVRKHVNLMGVLYIEEIIRKPEKRKGISGKMSLAKMDITQFINEGSLYIDYDPIVSAVKLNSASDLSSNSKENRSDFDYKVKPYYMSLNENKLPEGYQDYLGSRLRIYTTKASDVNIMGGGSASITLRDLLQKGFYFGVEPKKGASLSINPLKFELVISLDRESIKKESDWADKGVDNAAVFYVDHYIIDSSIYLEQKTYSHIPWR